MGNEVQILLTAVDNASKIISGTGLKWTEFNSALGLAKQGYEAINKVTDATVGKTVNYANTVRKMSSTLGVSSEEGSRLIQVFDDFGVSADQLKTILEMAAKNGFEPSIENLAELADKTNAMASPTERAAALSKIFGKNWSEVSEVLRQGGTAFREQAAGIEKSLVLTPEAIQQARDYEIALDNWNDMVLALEISIGSKLIPAITALLDPMYNAKELAKGNAGEIEKLTEQYKNAPPYIQRYYGAIVQDAEAIRLNATNTAYATRMNEQFKVSITNLLPVIAEVTTETAEERHQIEMIRKSFTSYGTAAAGATEETDKLGNALNKAATRARNITGAIKALDEPLENTREEAKKTQAVYNGLFTNVNLGLADNIAAEMDKIDWILAGGHTFDKAFAEVQAALEAGTITPEQADAYYKELYTGVTDLELELGNIDLSTAAQNLSDNLGIPIDEAWKLARQLNSTLLNLPTYTKLYIDIITNHIDVYNQPQGGGGHPNPPRPPKVDTSMAPNGTQPTAAQLAAIVKAQLNREVTAARRSGSFRAGRK